MTSCAPAPISRIAYEGRAQNCSTVGHQQRVFEKLVVVIPALNEERTISQVIGQIPDSIAPFKEINVVVVDDGSTDATSLLAKEAGALVVRHPDNRGVGASIASGIRAALSLGGDVIVHIDADGQFNAADIAQLVKLLVDGDFDLVTCTRFANREHCRRVDWLRRTGNKIVARLVNCVISGGTFTDVTCGFRAYTREAALRLTLYSNFTYTQESLLDLARKGARMAELPLYVKPTREHGRSRVAGNVLWYGLVTATIILRFMRDARPLTFFGFFAAAFVLFGTGCIGITAILTNDSISPVGYIIGAVSILVGGKIFITALMADQTARLRRLHEEGLYIARLGFYSRPDDRVELTNGHSLKTDLEEPGHEGLRGPGQSAPLPGYTTSWQ